MRDSLQARADEILAEFALPGKCDALDYNGGRRCRVFIGFVCHAPHTAEGALRCDAIGAYP